MNPKLARAIDRGDLETLRSIREREKSLRQQHKLRLRAKSSPRRQAEKAEEETKRLTWREIKARVLARSEGRCEIHWHALGKTVEGADPHHVISGPLKRKFEAVENVLNICRECHRRIDANDEEVLYDCLCPGLETVLSRKALDVVARRLEKVRRTRMMLEDRAG